MVASPKVLGPEKDCAAKGQQHIQMADHSSRQRGRPTRTTPQLSNSNKYLVMSPRWGSTPTLTEWLIVSRNVTLTLTLNWLWQKTDPSSRQRGRPTITRLNVKQQYISGHEHQMGLDTKTYWLTDRQLQCDFDFAFDFELASKPCGGGVEYFHRDPACRRRRRKEKSQMWDSKIWSRVPRDSDPRKTALTRANSICKRQIRPLVREGSP
jgi:hypothetical protein